MFYRCFFVFLFFSFFFLFLWSRAISAARPLCFTAAMEFFFSSQICRQLIVSNPCAYRDEIWQVDFSWECADRMFIWRESVKGFPSGRGKYHAFPAFRAYLHGWQYARPRRFADNEYSYTTEPTDIFYKCRFVSNFTINTEKSQYHQKIISQSFMIRFWSGLMSRNHRDVI